MSSLVDGPLLWVAGAVVVLSSMTVSQEESVRLEVREPVLVTADRPELPHSEPFVAVNPSDSDRMVAASIVFPDSAHSRVDAFVSRDGGQSWSRARLPGSDDLHALDPWLAAGPDGIFHLTVLGSTPEGRRTTYLYRSDDGGRSWSGPVRLLSGEGGSQDQEKLTVDTTRGPWRGRAYVAVQQWGPRTPGGESTDMVSLYTIDGLESPSEPTHVRPNNLRKSAWRPLVASDGTVIQFYSEWRRIRGGPRVDLVWSMFSEDGGETYSPASLVTDERSRSWFATAIATAGDHPDRAFAAWHYEDEDEDGRRLQVVHSDNLGRRWSEPVPLRRVPQGREAFFLRLEADGLGNLVAAWVEHDPVSEGRMCHEWFVALSTDGGESFGDATPVAPRACNPLPGEPRYLDGGGNLDPVLPRFARGGDYFGLAGLPGGGFQMVWAAPAGDRLQLWAAEVVVSGE